MSGPDKKGGKARSPMPVCSVHTHGAAGRACSLETAHFVNAIYAVNEQQPASYSGDAINDLSAPFHFQSGKVDVHADSTAYCSSVILAMRFPVASITRVPHNRVGKLRCPREQRGKTKRSRG